MRVLLFNAQSCEYFEGPHSWTSDPQQALDFHGTVHAAQAVFENRLRGVEIVLAFDETYLSNMHLPVTAPA